MGLAHIRANKAQCAIKPGTPEFEAWKTYFADHVGEYPYVFKLAMDDPKRERTFTVPTQWPEWFSAPAAIEHKQAAE